MKKAKSKTKEKPVEESKAVALPLNTEEQSVVDKWRQVEAENKVPFRLKASITPQATTYDVVPDSDRGSKNDQQDLFNATICSATGAKNKTFGVRLYTSCLTATGLIDEEKPNDAVNNANAIVDALSALKPQDEFEGMLVTQLVALHFQSMNYLSTSSSKNMSPQIKEMHINRATKLGRLFNEKLETLQKYRRKGTQQVIVQHVNVQNGAQAVIGDIHQGGGVSGKF